MFQRCGEWGQRPNRIRRVGPAGQPDLSRGGPAGQPEQDVAAWEPDEQWKRNFIELVLAVKWIAMGVK